MTAERFNKLAEEILAECSTTLITKAQEYADQDRLHNFKKAARMIDSTPEEVLISFRLKHDAALSDYVNWIIMGKKVQMKWVHEKVVDIINYNILLLALIEERIGE